MPRSGRVRAQVRSFRVQPDLWRAASAKAEADGHTMSDIINFFIKGYAEGLIDAPTIQLIFGRAGDVPVHRDSEVQGLDSDERPAPGQLEQGGVEHGHADTGLVRVVDLKRFANRHADPPIFKYAVFQGADLV